MKMMGVIGCGRRDLRQERVVYAISWIRDLPSEKDLVWLPSFTVLFFFSYDTTNMILLRQLLLWWLFLLVDHFALCVALSVDTSATFIAARVTKEFC